MCKQTKKTETATEYVLWKKVFLEISQNSQENNCGRPRPATLLKKSLWYRCFLVNFVKCLRTPFSQNTFGWDCLWKNKLTECFAKKNSFLCTQLLGFEPTIQSVAKDLSPLLSTSKATEITVPMGVQKVKTIVGATVKLQCLAKGKFSASKLPVLSCVLQVVKFSLPFCLLHQFYYICYRQKSTFIYFFINLPEYLVTL